MGFLRKLFAVGPWAKRDPEPGGGLILLTGEGVSLPHQVAQQWESRDQVWDTHSGRSAYAYLQGLQEKLLGHIRGQNIQSLLEIACGNGKLTRRILHEVPAIREATLVDINQAAVAEARSLLSDMDVCARIQFVRGNIYEGSTLAQIPPADLAVIFDSLMNLSNLKRAFEIVNGKLNDNGMFIGDITNAESELDVLGRPIGNETRQNRKLLAQYQRGNVLPAEISQYVFDGNALRGNNISPGELRRLLTETGFKIELLEAGFHLFFVSRKAHPVG